MQRQLGHATNRNPVGEGILGWLATGLAKLRPEDDPEAFLRTFGWMAKAADWEKSSWVAHIAPFLTGEAQAAY